jgi:hypothetical protein
MNCALKYVPKEAGIYWELVTLQQGPQIIFLNAIFRQGLMIYSSILNLAVVMLQTSQGIIDFKCRKLI